jgi:hypothetical protein
MLAPISDLVSRPTYKSTQPYNLEDQHEYFHLCENLRSRLAQMYLLKFPVTLSTEVRKSFYAVKCVKDPKLTR